MSTQRTPSDNFKFYINCAKPLVLNLPSPKDRLFACAWLKRLSDDADLSPSSKTVYLMLFIHFLQKQQMGGPFLHHPNSVHVLPELPQDRNVEELLKTAESSDQHTPYLVDFSSDLRTYFAAQEVPNLGVHCYYALSNSPMVTWEKFDETVLPRRIKHDTNTFLEMMDEENQTVTPKASDTVGELEGRKAEFAGKLYKNAGKGRREVKQVMPPLGAVIRKEEERRRPTWGSNLITLEYVAIDDED